MISRLAMQREYGVPGIHTKIETAIQQKVADNIAKGHFSITTINLPTDSFYHTFRNDDFVAVLSMNKFGQKVQKLALWSIPIARKLWESTIEEKFTGTNPGTAIVSNSGIVVVASIVKDRHIIVLDGKVSGQMDLPENCTIALVGNRILGWWMQRHTYDAQPCYYPENSDKFFGEWDQTGTLRRSFQLDFTWGRGAHHHCFNEYYWVRLTGKWKADQSSLIEVFDRITKKMNTAVLPLNPDEEEFTSSCIVKDRLFFGKNFKRSEGLTNVKFSRDPTVCIFDLLKGRVVEEFWTGEQGGHVKLLVANDTYVAWLNDYGSLKDAVKYRKISDRKIRIASEMPFEYERHVDLKLMGSILSVTHAVGSCLYGGGRWQRKVIDLTTGELVQNVRYKRVHYGSCTLSNGHLLITDCYNQQNKMYVESFFNEGSSKEMSEFRI